MVYPAVVDDNTPDPPTSSVDPDNPSKILDPGSPPIEEDPAKNGAV